MTDPFKARLKQIEDELHKFFPKRVSSYWTGHAAGETLPSVSKSQLKKILEPGMALLGRGGKRWRPLIMLLCCEISGGGGKALSLTPLVEFPHNGSLIIDDIEDNSMERRGGSAIHLEFGLDMAVNTGNFMYFLPTSIIETCPLKNADKLIIYRYYTEDMRRLHIGQGLDILWHRDHSYVPEIEEYLQMCRLKTGSMARMAARIGIVAGCGDEELAYEVGSLAENFGTAFQINDDVKNLSTGIPGKQRGDDIIEGKKSLPLILYLKDNPGEAIRVKEIFDYACGKSVEQAVDVIDELIKRLTDAKCLKRAENLADELLRKSCDRLQELFPPSESLKLLNSLIHRLISA